MGRPRVGVESGGEPELKIEIRADAAADAPIGASQCITTRTGDFTPTFATASCGATCTQQFVGPAGETQSCPSPMHEDIGAWADVATPGTHVATADVTTATMIHSATSPAARIRITSILVPRSQYCQPVASPAAHEVFDCTVKFDRQICRAQKCADAKCDAGLLARVVMASGRPPRLLIEIGI